MAKLLKHLKKGETVYNSSDDSPITGRTSIAGCENILVSEQLKNVGVKLFETFEKEFNKTEKVEAKQSFSTQSSTQYSRVNQCNWIKPSRILNNGYPTQIHTIDNSDGSYTIVRTSLEPFVVWDLNNKCYCAEKSGDNYIVRNFVPVSGNINEAEFFIFVKDLIISWKYFFQVTSKSLVKEALIPFRDIDEKGYGIYLQSPSRNGCFIHNVISKLMVVDAKRVRTEVRKYSSKETFLAMTDDEWNNYQSFSYKVSLSEAGSGLNNTANWNGSQGIVSYTAKAIADVENKYWPEEHVFDEDGNLNELEWFNFAANTLKQSLVKDYDGTNDKTHFLKSKDSCIIDNPLASGGYSTEFGINYSCYTGKCASYYADGKNYFYNTGATAAYAQDVCFPTNLMYAAERGSSGTGMSSVSPLVNFVSTEVEICTESEKRTYINN